MPSASPINITSEQQQPTTILWKKPLKKSNLAQKNPGKKAHRQSKEQKYRYYARMTNTFRGRDESMKEEEEAAEPCRIEEAKKTMAKGGLGEVLLALAPQSDG